MRTTQRWMVLGAIGIVVASVACTGNAIDDGDSAGVVLEVLGLQTTAVTGTSNIGQCETSGDACFIDQDCDPDSNEDCLIEINAEGCQVTNWSLQLSNVALSEASGTSPFNDIVMSSISAQYRTNLGALLWEREIPMTCTVRAGQTASCPFSPIAFDDLVVDNTTLNITGLLRGATVAGENVSAAFGAQLNIEMCLPPIP